MIDFIAEAEQCSICGSALHIFKSSCRLRPVMSLQVGPFIPREVHKQCVKDSTHPVVHSEALARIVRPRQRYAYDIIVQVGLARYLRDMRREDIRVELLQQRSIDISEGAVSNIEKDHAAGWGEVWVIAKDAKLRNRIEAQWAARERQSGAGIVRFLVVTDPQICSAGSEPERPSQPRTSGA